MRFTSLLAAGCSIAALLASPAYAQEAPATEQPVATPDESDDAIVVTARKREETLIDVPIAASAISGDTLESRGINSVREAAALSPGLNINSDGAGRAFVAIRGVGVTLVQSVQPGVGLFIDGIYQPNTSYLNNPLNDVARIEVLRGPQGTLYGKNTLGGAINVITRQPGNDFEGRAMASYAGPDDSWMVAGSVSMPIVTDKLAIRVGVAHRQQDGFQKNTLIGGYANPLNTESVNTTVRLTPADGFTLTVKGYYDNVVGANTPYSRISGPRDYSRNVEYNTPNLSEYQYYGFNAKAEADVGGGSTLSLIGAYDHRDTKARETEGDFGPVNLIRGNVDEDLSTQTLEMRLNSEWSDSISTLFGLFYSSETYEARTLTQIVPFGISNSARNMTDAQTYAAFGNIFWKPNVDWEVALGLRYDHEDRRSRGFVNGVAATEQYIKSNEWQPRLSITRKWDNRFMTYASVARGYRGGGFNAITAPVRTYKGDSAWTYEVGSKYAAPGGAFTISGALFYSDYKDYIGLNSIAPASTGGLVTVDLNTGDVKSYGAELEVTARPTENWTLSGGLTLMHARITDDSAYTAVTGRKLSSDRLTFQPDIMGSLYSDYVIPMGDDNELKLTAGVTYKGKRLAATLNETTPTILPGYALVNGSISYRHGPMEFAVFANNIFNRKYYESYIEKTTLILAGIPALTGLPATDLGIMGDARRYGVRASFKF